MKLIIDQPFNSYSSHPLFLRVSYIWDFLRRYFGPTHHSPTADLSIAIFSAFPFIRSRHEWICHLAKNRSFFAWYLMIKCASTESRVDEGWLGKGVTVNFHLRFFLLLLFGQFLWLVDQWLLNIFELGLVWLGMDSSKDFSVTEEVLIAVHEFSACFFIEWAFREGDD